MLIGKYTIFSTTYDLHPPHWQSNVTNNTVMYNLKSNDAK